MSKIWSEYEIEYLFKFWGTKSVSHFSKKFNRTENAIIVKAKRLGLNGVYNDVMLRSQVANILNVNIYRINKWTKENKFPMVAKKLHLKETRYIIEHDKLLKWLELNQELWSAKDVKEYTLGVEPKWLVDKRRNDYNTEKIGRWTKEEDRMILKLYMEGKYPREIAEIYTKRTYKSIESRIHRLNSFYA